MNVIRGRNPRRNRDAEEEKEKAEEESGGGTQRGGGGDGCQYIGGGKWSSRINSSHLKHLNTESLIY